MRILVGHLEWRRDEGHGESDYGAEDETGSCSPFMDFHGHDSTLE